MQTVLAPQFRSGPRPDILAQATAPTPLRIVPLPQFEDKAVRIHASEGGALSVVPEGALRNFAAMSVARKAFSTAPVTTEQVLSAMTNGGLLAANLGVSAIITAHLPAPSGDHNSRRLYLGCVRQVRADFEAMSSSSIPATNKHLSGYVNWRSVSGPTSDRCATAIRNSLIGELSEGEILPTHENQGQAQLLKGMLHEILPSMISRELLLTSEDHFSGLFDTDPTRSFTVRAPRSDELVKLPSIGYWNPVQVDGTTLDVGINYYSGLGALQVMVPLTVEFPKDLTGLSVKHVEYSQVTSELAAKFGGISGKPSGLAEMLDPFGFRWIPIENESRRLCLEEGLFVLKNGRMERIPDIDARTERFSEGFIPAEHGIVHQPYATLEDLLLRYRELLTGR